MNQLSSSELTLLLCYGTRDVIFLRKCPGQDNWLAPQTSGEEVLQGVYFSPMIAKGACGDYFSHVDNCIMNLTLLSFTSASVRRDSQRDRYPCVVQKKSSLSTAANIYWGNTGSFLEIPASAHSLMRTWDLFLLNHFWSAFWVSVSHQLCITNPTR